jgi:hypothetical protein
MLSMQDFHEWLSSGTKADEAYRRNLALLSRASLTKILNVRADLGDLGWHIWEVSKQPSPSKAQG